MQSPWRINLGIKGAMYDQINIYVSSPSPTHLLIDGRVERKVMQSSATKSYQLTKIDDESRRRVAGAVGIVVVATVIIIGGRIAASFS